jgi:hypothetical protein
MRKAGLGVAKALSANIPQLLGRRLLYAAGNRSSGGSAVGVGPVWVKDAARV